MGYLKNLLICYGAGEHMLRNVISSSSCLTTASHNQRLFGKQWRVVPVQMWYGLLIVSPFPLLAVTLDKGKLRNRDVY